MNSTFADDPLAGSDLRHCSPAIRSSVSIFPLTFASLTRTPVALFPFLKLQMILTLARKIAELIGNTLPKTAER